LGRITQIFRRVARRDQKCHASADMRLSCPNCLTEYEVPDAAIAGRARKLRCAHCGHQWMQGLNPAPEAPAQPPGAAPIPEPAAEPEPKPVAAPVLEPAAEILAEPEPAPEPVAEPVAEQQTEPAPPETVAPDPEPAAVEVAHEPERAVLVPEPTAEAPPEAAPPEALSDTVPDAILEPIAEAPAALADAEPELATTELAAPPLHSWAPPPPAPAGWPAFAPENASIAEPLETERTFGVPVDEEARAEVVAAAADEIEPHVDVADLPDPSAPADSPPAVSAPAGGQAALPPGRHPLPDNDSFAALVSAARRRSLEYEPEPPRPPVDTSNMKAFILLLVIFVIAVLLIERRYVMAFIPATAGIFHALGLK
jgi:predicted Zn finger-like uncharacterized protein